MARRALKTLTFGLFLGILILSMLGALMGAVVSEKGVQTKEMLWFLPEKRQPPVIYG